jgi:hypothetical protein
VLSSAATLQALPAPRPHQAWSAAWWDAVAEVASTSRALLCQGLSPCRGCPRRPCADVDRSRLRAPWFPSSLFPRQGSTGPTRRAGRAASVRRAGGAPGVPGPHHTGVGRQVPRAPASHIALARHALGAMEASGRRGATASRNGAGASRRRRPSGGGGPGSASRERRAEGSDIHVMLAKRFRVTVGQSRFPRERRSTVSHGHSQGVSTMSVIPI